MEELYYLTQETGLERLEVKMDFKANVRDAKENIEKRNKVGWYVHVRPAVRRYHGAR